MLKYSITVTCDAPGCAATHTVGATVRQPTSSDVPHFGRYGSPFEGWRVGEYGERCATLCPDHAEQARKAAELAATEVSDG